MTRAIASSAAAVVTLAVLGCKATVSAPVTESKNALAHAGESWCPEGFESGPSDTCFAIPAHPTKETPVLVYLHGMYEGRGQPEEWSTLRVALEHGFAVVIPRGKRGLCAWRAELKDHYCWPLDPEDTDAIKGVVREWERVLFQVDALLDGGTHKRYVLGSANGGTFAGLLATHALFAGQAYAVVNGGPLGEPAKTKPVPVLLVSAEAEQGAKAKELHDTLSKASWPHAFCSRVGGASMTREDVDGAVRFFKRDADGTLRTQQGAYACDSGSMRK